MSKVEAHASLRERQEAMQRHWPDHRGYCTLRPLHAEYVAHNEAGRRAPNGGIYPRRTQCGVALVPLTVDTDYLSVRCPSCRVVTIHQRIVPLNG